MERGLGLKESIWDDKWLPTRHYNSILSPHPPNSSLNHVMQIIDEQSNTWKERIIKITFLPHEAKAILGIPLSSKHLSDTIIWGETKDRVYPVRSRYHLLLTESYQDSPGFSDTFFAAQVLEYNMVLADPSKSLSLSVVCLPRISPNS